MVCQHIFVVLYAVHVWTFYKLVQYLLCPPNVEKCADRVVTKYSTVSSSFTIILWLL